MKKYLSALMLLLVAPVVCAQSSFELADGYPIEVMGASSTTVGTEMPAGTVGTFVFFKIHSVSYPTHLELGPKVLIRVSEGDWVPVTNANAVCPGREIKAGCVEGPQATVRFGIPVTILGDVAGSDSIYYRFNYIEAPGNVSSGFRVLAAQHSLFSELDRTPAPPDPVPDDTVVTPPPPPIEEIPISGEDLFTARESLQDFPGGPIITAACSDCHAVDGRDLKYFGFSENSIVTRSIFHGLSRAEGQAISDFILDSEIETYGTPWDPPYQPGPEVGDRAQWAAGAGLDDVLEEDSLYVLDVAAIDLDETFNKTQAPVAIDFPDWNEWLPVFHPVDVWADGSFWQSRPYQEYTALRAALESGPPSSRFVRDLDSWFDAVKDAERSDATFDVQERSDRFPLDYSLYQWHAVKLWELMQEFDLEGIASDYYPQGESLSWLGQGRSPFNLGPHIHGQSKGKAGQIPHAYFTTSWYEAQTVINSGNKSTTSLKPVDWKYQYGFIRDWTKIANDPHPQRFMQSYLKVLQAGAQLQPREINPRHFWISKLAQLGPAEGRSRGCGKNPFCRMPEDERRVYANAFLDQFLVYLERHPVSAWDGVLEGPDEVPVCDGSAYLEKNFANATKCIIEQWDGFVEDRQINRFKDWAEQRWPGGNW